MLEIRFHGRGGQGAVTSAELLAQAAIKEGKYARAFPSFGPERRGAPVSAFCRLDDKPINLRTVIKNPHAVVVLDPSLYEVVDVTSGLRDKGHLVINTGKDPRAFFTEELEGLAAVNASLIAREILKRPITNTVMLGALVRLLPLVKLDSLGQALEERFNEKIAQKNIQALERSYRETLILGPKDLEPGEEKAGKKVLVKNNRKDAGAAAKTGFNGNRDKKDHMYSWEELPPGCVVKPGSTRENLTGDWRSSYPLLNRERCIKCGLCWIFCPDASLTRDQEGFYKVDFDYCKGCGICARECPAGAIQMEKELEG